MSKLIEPIKHDGLEMVQYNSDLGYSRAHGFQQHPVEIVNDSLASESMVQLNRREEDLSQYLEMSKNAEIDQIKAETAQKAQKK